MTDVGVAATQMVCSWERDANIDRAENLVRQAAAEGASIVLMASWLRWTAHDAVFCHNLPHSRIGSDEFPMQ